MRSVLPTMVLELITARERERHEKAIAKIRERLFSRHHAEDYRVAPVSECVIAAYAESRWNAACGDYRVLHLGGLSYAVDCADEAGLSRFCVPHEEDDRFSFWLSAAKGHTVNSLLLRFRELDELPFMYVSSYRRSCARAIPQRCLAAARQ